MTQPPPHAPQFGRSACARRVAAAATLLVALGSASCAYAGLLVDIGSPGALQPCGLCGSTGRTFGYAFSLSEAVVVSALGAWDQDSDGLDVDTQVGLFNSAGQMLASATIDAAATAQASALADGRWLMAAVAPLQLSPGHYLIGQVFFDGLPLAQLDPGLITPAYLTVTGGMHSPDVDAGLRPPVDDFAAGALLGPTLSAQVLAEPGSLGLCLAALAAYGAGHRRRAGRPSSAIDHH